MTKLFNYLLALSIPFVFTTCSALEGDKTTYTLSGKLVESCENLEGVAGVELWLQKEKDAGKIEWLDNVTTAADGSFELKYEADQGAGFGNVYLKKRGIYSNTMIMMGIPTKQNLDLGLVYNEEQKVEVVISIDKAIPTTVNDTLYLGRDAVFFSKGQLVKGNYLPIPGPFFEGQEILKYVHPGTPQWFGDSEDNVKYIDTDYINSGPGITYHLNGLDTYQKVVGSLLAAPCKINRFNVSIDSTLLN
jgi:hypothetical protein